MGNICKSEVDIENGIRVDNCIFCPRGKQLDTLDRKHTGVFTEHQQTIVILNCVMPHKNGLILDYAHIEDTDVYIFDSDMKYISSNGKNISRLGGEIQDPRGHYIKDVLPDYMWRFVEAIYKET